MCTSALVLIALLLAFATPAAATFLDFVEVQKDSEGGVDGLDAANTVAVSPDGRHVYAGSAEDDAVAVFSRDLSTGKLIFVEVERDGVGGVDGLDNVTAVTVSPDGKHVYAAGNFDDAVAVFSRDAGTGTLTFVEIQQEGVAGVDGLNGVEAVVVSPDGKHVYTAAGFDDAVTLFSRDAGTGKLTFVELQRDSVGGVDGLDGAVDVTISPDGKHVYSAATNDDAIAVFSRDSGTGQLTFVETLMDGVGGVDGLALANSVTVSPDGKHVYVAASTDDHAIAVFSRDASTGALTLVEVQRDGVGGVDGLFQAGWVTVSPDGRYVYGAGFGEDAIAVFSRDRDTGRLTFIEVQRDGVGGVDGLDGASAVAVSPDGRHVYVTGVLDDAVAVFAALAASAVPLLSSSVLLFVVAAFIVFGGLRAAGRTGEGSGTG